MPRKKKPLTDLTTEEVMRKAYQDHRAEIQTIARAHIENGWIDEDNRVFLTTRFTTLTVTFKDNLEGLPGGRAIADSAHRILSGIIGPDAKTVNVDWSANADAPGQSVLNVQITDPTTGRSAAESFDPKESADPSTLRFRLASLWGDILRERSRVLNLQAG